MTSTYPVLFRIEKIQTSVGYKLMCSFAFALLTAWGAQIKIPLGFTPVPFTLQTLFVFSSGMALGAEFGALSQIIYIVMGTIGLPVFAGGSAGLFGPTAGYLAGFVLFSYFSGILFYKFEGSVIAKSALFFALSSVAIFVPGVIVLKLALTISWQKSLILGFYPFIIGDLLKIFAATSIWEYFNRKI